MGDTSWADNTDHLANMRNCKWCEIDCQVDMTPAYRCLSPASKAVLAAEPEFCDVFCLNPDIVPCADWELQVEPLTRKVN